MCCQGTILGLVGDGACGAWEAALDWHEIYARRVRYPEHPDAAAWAELQRRVGAWAAMRGAGLHREVAPEVAAETCAEVWRMLQLARGGAGFEGFVQGRFVEVVRRLTEANVEDGPAPASHGPEPTPPGPGAQPSPPSPRLRERGSNDAISGEHIETVTGAGEWDQHGDTLAEPVVDEAEVRAARRAARLGRLQKALEELRKRNPLHHRAVSLVYLDEASVAEAGDALAVDGWQVRLLLARAREALGQEVDRAERVREARQAGETTGRGKPGRARAAARKPDAGGGKPQAGGTGGGKPRAGGGKPGRPGAGQRKGRPPGGGRSG